MTREEDLRERTYKGGKFDLVQRLSHTLNEEPSKHDRAITFLVKHLREKKIISDDDIDQMLLDVVGPRPF